MVERQRGEHLAGDHKRDECRLLCDRAHIRSDGQECIDQQFEHPVCPPLEYDSVKGPSVCSSRRKNGATQTAHRAGSARQRSRERYSITNLYLLESASTLESTVSSI